MKKLTHRSVYVGLLVLGLSLSAAQATSVVPLSLSEQAKQAQVILRATAGAPSNEKEGDVNYTAYPLTISETILGDSSRLPQINNKPAVYFLQGAADLPTLSEGQEGIFLLYTAKMDSPIVGYNQGFYPIVAGRVVPSSISDSALSSSGTAVQNGASGSTSSKAPVTFTDPLKLRDAIREARGGQ